MDRLDYLIEEVRFLQSSGLLSKDPSDAQRISWAYGNAALSNPDVTRAMAEQAVAQNPSQRTPGILERFASLAHGTGHVMVAAEDLAKVLSLVERLSAKVLELLP